MYSQHANDESQQPTGDGDRGAGVFENENAKAFSAAADVIRSGKGADPSVIARDECWPAQQQQVISLPKTGFAEDVATDELDNLPVLSSGTSEHKVLMPLTGTRVTKVTWPGVYGQVPYLKDGNLERRNALPSEYLDRQALQIEIFASDITFRGVNVSSKPSMILGEPAGQPSFVITQRFVNAANRALPSPTPEEIAAFLGQFGFRAVRGSYFGWIRRVDGVAIVDAKPDNFIMSSEGVVPIDLQMAIIPELIAETEPSVIVLPS